MSNIIDKIQVSGVTYDIQGSGGGGGNPTVELTQAEYDALVTAGTVSADTYYIITDAQAGDLTQYWTSAQTQSAITQSVSGKQDTLSAGTNITIVDNVISAEGGGKAIEAGRGISITTGETADTVSFNLPISAGTGTNSIKENYNSNIASGAYSHVEGSNSTASGDRSHAEGYYSTASGSYSHTEGQNCYARKISSHAEGTNTDAKENYSHTEGFYTIANNQSEHASGQYNVSSKASTTFGDSGNTLFSVGNGTSTSARHNAFEIRQNGDIYLSSGGTDIKLQDHLGGGGGGGSTYTAGDGIDITNNVISVTGKADTSAVTEVSDALTAHTANTNVHLTTTEKTNLDSLATNISAISGITASKKSNWDTAYSRSVANAVSYSTNTSDYMSFINKIWVGTQSQYDNLNSWDIDNYTLYIIKDNN